MQVDISDFKLFDAEMKFMDIVWENEPLRSRELVKLCAERLGWKQSTTFTVLKKLSNRGIVKNEATVVTSLVGRDQVQRYESEAIVKKSFGGSLPSFIAAFMSGKRLSDEEADELKKLIDSYREGGK